MPDNIGELGYAWTFLGVIIALGAITIAFLQILNELTPMRSLLHAAWLRRWIGERARAYQSMVEGKGGSKPGPSDPQQQSPQSPAISWLPTLSIEEQEPRAFDMLVAVATGGHGLAFLGLPTNQLVGQINAAAQTVIENPILYYALLCVLAQPTLPTVRPFVWGTPKTELPAGTHLKDLNKICEIAKSNVGKSEPDYLEARARVGHAIQRNLDGIQITLTNRSAQSTLSLSLVISLGLAFIVLPGATPLNIVLTGASGGYVAPLIGDIVTTIRRLGQR